MLERNKDKSITADKLMKQIVRDERFDWFLLREKRSKFVTGFFLCACGRLNLTVSKGNVFHSVRLLKDQDVVELGSVEFHSPPGIIWSKFGAHRLRMERVSTISYQPY